VTGILGPTPNESKQALGWRWWPRHCNSASL